MLVENTVRTAKIKIFYAVIIANVIAISMYNSFEHNAAWLEWALWAVVGIIIAIYAGMLILRYNYFFLEHKNNKIFVKYYIAHPFGRKYKAFELPAKSVYRYKIKESLSGLKKDLYLVAQTPKGIFNFPPLSISLLNTKEISSLKYILDGIVTK